MCEFFPNGVSVITCVVLGSKAGQVEPVRKFRLARSEVDMAKNFALRSNGQPVLGERLYRERTKAEIKATGLTGAAYLTTLVPLSNCGTPYWEPPAVAA